MINKILIQMIAKKLGLSVGSTKNLIIELADEIEREEALNEHESN